MPFARLFLVAVALCASSCLPSEDDATTTFKDDLRFGTGLGGNGFQLVGESETFTKATTSMLTFRLESSANFEGRFVRLYFDGLTNKDFAACANPDAHICLSSFPTVNPGTYTVKAYLVKTTVDIGKETFVASRTITVN